ncbi:hypothetical protein GCM10023340_19280 [Nocardioides marinquilinus]|uniref:HAMP domain-containing protein n=1 Tax=Nocardioides marinquilinus TaxID=1210400 RepID=A0ABP9PIK1_9ACTN
MPRLFAGLVSVAEDVGVTVVALLSAVVAVAVGVVATLHVTGDTPYSQADLDRAAAASRLQAEAPPTSVEPVAATDRADDVRTPAVRRLQRDLEEAREQVRTLERTGTRSRRAARAAEDEVATLRTRLKAAREKLAEATADDPTTEVTDDPTFPLQPLDPTDPTDPADPGTTEEPLPDATVTGTLQTSWTLSPRRKPWPRGCPSVMEGYRVAVTSSDGERVAEVRARDVDLVDRRVTAGGDLRMVCQGTYSATLPQPLAGSYDFWAVTAARPGTPLDESLVADTTVTSGAAPALTVLFCPGC